MVRRHLKYFTISKKWVGSTSVWIAVKISWWFGENLSQVSKDAIRSEHIPDFTDGVGEVRSEWLLFHTE